MLGRGFILLALSGPSLFTTAAATPAPAPNPANVDSFAKNIGSPDTKRSIDINVDLAGLNLGVTLGGSRIIDFDQARASYKMKLFSNTTEEKRDTTEDVQATNAGVLYTASVGVGSPATQYTLVIDTGSANTWVGAGQAYTQTSTSSSTGQNVSVGYGSGGFSGVEYYDQVSLSDTLTVTNFSIGVASSSSGFDSYDGILGLAPAALTSNTVTNTDTVPTLPDALASAGTISSEVLGVSFAPTTSAGTANGVLTLGGASDAQYTGDITYAPITSLSPASKYWGIDLDVAYGSADNGSQTTLLSGAAGIVDTGTTLVLLAEEAYDAYVNATGAVLDASVGLLAVDDAAYANLQSMFFTVAGTQFELTRDAQTWPRALNSFVNGNESATYLVVGSSGTHEGNGLDFMLGYTFLERYYSVYDSVQKRVGFAQTSNTFAVVN